MIFWKNNFFSREKLPSLISASLPIVFFYVMYRMFRGAGVGMTGGSKSLKFLINCFRKGWWPYGTFWRGTKYGPSNQ